MMRIMRFDKQKLAALAALPDAELWAQIVQLGKEHGISIPPTPPPHAELERLRGVIGDPDKMRMSDAIRVVNDYKKKYMK